LRVFPRVFAGTHVRHPAVEVLRGRRVRLEAPGIVAYADGERVGPLPLDCEVVPAALRVLVAS
jgi:diacylglycerol kinase (ATP)